MASRPDAFDVKILFAVIDAIRPGGRLPQGAADGQEFIALMEPFVVIEEAAVVSQLDGSVADDDVGRDAARQQLRDGVQLLDEESGRRPGPDGKRS